MRSLSIQPQCEPSDVILRRTGYIRQMHLIGITQQLVVRQRAVSRRCPGGLAHFLLLAMILCTVVFIVLLQVAALHRASSTSSSASGSTSRRSTAQKARGPYKGPVSTRFIRMEDLLSKDVLSVSVHAIAIQQHFREQRIVQILEHVQNSPLKWLEDALASLPEAGRHSVGQRTDLDDVVSARNDSAQADWDSATSDFGGQCVNEELPHVVPYCPQVPPQLEGTLFEFNHTHNVSMETVISDHMDVCPGGWWKPSHCKARHRVAIIIPYRDRREHLSALLQHLHPILKRQQLDYKIYVVEQSGNQTFNKGILMNAAFLLALREADYHCFIFHDVDLLPEDDRNMYSCPEYPRHMSVGVDKFNYTLPYVGLVGGVFAARTDHFLKLNGYSNLYWGWGGEDDDMANRIFAAGSHIIRPTFNVARYRMIKHTGRTVLTKKIKYKLLATTKKRMPWDGLNSVNFTLQSWVSNPLYTNFTLDVGNNPFALANTPDA